MTFKYFKNNAIYSILNVHSWNISYFQKQKMNLTWNCQCPVFFHLKRANYFVLLLCKIQKLNNNSIIRTIPYIYYFVKVLVNDCVFLWCILYPRLIKKKITHRVQRETPTIYISGINLWVFSVTKLTKHILHLNTYLYKNWWWNPKL